jgi:hypothetical protein
MDVRKLVMMAATLMLAFGAASCAEKPATPPKPAASSSAAPAAKAQTTCPIMGNPIDKTQYVDVDGYRIYACCPACLPKIKADPQAAIAAIRAKGEEPQKLAP